MPCSFFNEKNSVGPVLGQKPYAKIWMPFGTENWVSSGLNGANILIKPFRVTCGPGRVVIRLRHVWVNLIMAHQYPIYLAWCKKFWLVKSEKWANPNSRKKTLTIYIESKKLLMWLSDGRKLKRNYWWNWSDEMKVWELWQDNIFLISIPINQRVFYTPNTLVFGSRNFGRGK